MEDLSEKEQLDAMRAWWAENGSYVVGGIVVGMIVIFGWNRWQAGIADAEIAASALYEDVMSAAGRGNLDAAAEPAAALFSKYASTPYAAHARLAMASLYMDRSRDQDAADALRALIESDPEKELAMVGRLRLAKVLLYQGKAEEVIELVGDRVDTAFAARFSEVLGDAYVSMGSYAQAEAAYIGALNDNPAAPTVDINLIQLKINDLPAASEVATTGEEDAAGSEPDPDSEPAAEDGSASDEPRPQGGADSEPTADGETEVE